MPLLRRVLGEELPGDADQRLGHTLERFLSGPPALLAAPELGDGGAAGYAQPLERLLKTIRERYAPAVASGAQLLQQLEQSRLLPTGCTCIDGELLRGGLREGQVTEVCGESASGKTQLCLMAAAQTASRGEAVAYIDTSNAFTAGRLLGMLQAVAAAGAAVDQALALVRVHRAYDAHAVLSVLDALLQQQCQPQPSLIVVDSLSAVIAPVLGGGAGQHSQGHAVLAACAAALKCLAERTGAAVIVTNHMVGGGEGARGEKRPAMGESWRNQPHVRMHLAPAAGAGATAAGPQQPDGMAESGRHVATLRASTISAMGPQVSYWLAREGLVPTPPGGTRAVR